MVRHPTQVQLAMVRKTGGHRKEHRDQYTKADDRPALLETDGTNGRNIAKLISSTSHYIFPLIIKSTLHWRASRVAQW